MTTFWARMLVYKAWEKGEITEECAHYFDELLNHYKTNCELHEIEDFNKYHEYRFCVLQNIATNDECEFQILDYIKKTTYEKDGEKPVYLANIIHEDYNLLGEEIENYMNSKKADLTGLATIYDYLISTYFEYKKPNKGNDEILIKLCNKIFSLGGNGQTITKQNKSYKKPAYTDLLDADY